MNMRALLLLAASTVALSGCNSGFFKSFKSSSKDNVDPPAELVAFTPTVTVKRLWSDGLGDGGAKAGLRLTPASADGKIYADSADGRVYAFDGASGRKLWSYEAKTRLASGPSVADGLCIVGGRQGEVIALDAGSGAERWRAKVSSEVYAAPGIGGGKVIVRSHDGRVFGLDAADGTRRWVYDRSEPLLTLRGNSPPVVGAGQAFIGFDDGKLLALALDDGKVIWEQVVGQSEGRTEVERLIDIDGPIAFARGALFTVTYRGQLAALAADSGRVLWSRDMSSYGGVALNDDKLVVADVEGTVWSIDPSTGASLWSQTKLAHRLLTTPAIVGGYAVVGDVEGYVHWLKLDDGSFAARERLDRKGVRAPPLAAGSTVYVVGANGDLAAYSTGG